MKIRFIKKCSKVTDEVTNYQIEEKKLFGWKRLGYTIEMGYGSTYCYYEDKDKKELLKKVLEDRKLCLNFIDITEYPSIKEY